MGKWTREKDRQMERERGVQWFCGSRFQAYFSAVLNAVCGLGPRKLRFKMRFAFLGKFYGLRISMIILSGLRFH